MHSAIEPRPFDPVTLYKALFLAVVVVFVATPLLATVLGGFKSLGELRTNPFGLPKVWECEHYADILFSKRYWQLLRNSRDHLDALGAADADRRLDGGVRVRAHQVLRPHHAAQLFHHGAVVSGRDRDPAAVHQGARSRPARHLFRRGAAAGRVQPRDEHPAAAALLQGPAGRAARGGAGRRLQLLRLLPSRDIAAVAADPGDGRHHRVRAQLERLPGAAGDAQLGQPLSLAARHHGVSGRIFLRMAPDPGVHHADDPADDPAFPAGADATSWPASRPAPSRADAMVLGQTRSTA